MFIVSFTLNLVKNHWFTTYASGSSCSSLLLRMGHDTRACFPALIRSCEGNRNRFVALQIDDGQHARFRLETEHALVGCLVLPCA